MKYIKVAVPDDFELGSSQIGQIHYSDEVLGGAIPGSTFKLWEPEYVKVLDHGFVGLIDFMGSDEDIAQAARVSYARGTKKVSGTRGLIRYLLRHRHTTPFEMCEVKFHIKLPIFVERQWIRHRTASTNEMSARYSILDNEMYIPEPENTAVQATSNKQGRGEVLNQNDYRAVKAALEQSYHDSYETYQYLLGHEMRDVDGVPTKVKFNPPDAINMRKLHAEESAMNAILALRKQATERGETFEMSEEAIRNKVNQFFEAVDLAVTGPDFEGLARELARMCLPVATYTQKYWKTNLWNLMNFLRLRLDPHAQYEVRVYAQAVYDLVQPIYPDAFGAFDDYIRYSKTFSRMDLELIGKLLTTDQIAYPENTQKWFNETAKELGMSDRERDELYTWAISEMRKARA